MMLNALSAALRLAVPATRAGRLVTLIYHRVRPQPDAMFPDEVDATRFRWQMELVREYFNPLPLSVAVQGLREGRLPPRSCAVTFDDGYADNATVALPILQSCGVPATFFVATAFLDGGRMWNDSVIEAVRRAPAGTRIDTAFAPDLPPVDTMASRRLVAMAIIKALKHLPLEERQGQVETLREKIGAELPTDMMMTQAQVRLLSDAGMEIGAHTVHHPILRTLGDRQARDEIGASREALQAIIGKPVTSFAYPNGRPGHDYSARDRDIVRDLGFEFAVSTARGAGHARSDFYQLPRFTPWDRSSSRWLARLAWEFGSPA